MLPKTYQFYFYVSFYLFICVALSSYIIKNYLGWLSRDRTWYTLQAVSITLWHYIYLQPEQEVRLFDKGEMNTYREETTFVHLVAQLLRQFVLWILQEQNTSELHTTFHPKEMDSSEMISASVSSQSSESAASADQWSAASNTASQLSDCYIDQDRPLVSKQLQVLRDIKIQVSVKLESMINSQAVICHDEPFLNTSRYQSDRVQEFRLLMCVWSLSSVSCPSYGPEWLRTLIERVKTLYSGHGVCNEMLASILQCLENTKLWWDMPFETVINKR